MHLDITRMHVTVQLPHDIIKVKVRLHERFDRNLQAWLYRSNSTIGIREIVNYNERSNESILDTRDASEHVQLANS